MPISMSFELMLYILKGKVRHEFEPGLKQVLENEAGDPGSCNDQHGRARLIPPLSDARFERKDVTFLPSS
jgi:hypothetical protein